MTFEVDVSDPSLRAIDRRPNTTVYPSSRVGWKDIWSWSLSTEVYQTLFSAMEIEKFPQKLQFDPLREPELHSTAIMGLCNHLAD